VVILPAAAASVAPELIHDPVVLTFSRSLVAKAASERFREQGAFAVRTREGILYFVAWPPGEEHDRLRWHGRFPEGTIAILHTHPPHRGEPSKLDVTAARHSGLPVYVLTPGRVVRTTGEETAVILEGDW
jgi:hypothetical protein